MSSESSRVADDALESSSESARSVGATLKQTLATVHERGLTDWAASLTYYAILSVFPMLIALVSLLGIFGEYPRTSNALINIVQQVAPGTTVDVLRGPIEHGAKSQSGAGLVFLIGIGASIWAASGYLGAFFRAANIAWDATEDRPFWKLRPIQVVLTVIMLAGLTLIGMALVITGPVATAVGDSIGLGSTTLTIWRWAKWPVIVLAVLTLLSLVFYTAQRQAAWVPLDLCRHHRRRRRLGGRDDPVRPLRQVLRLVQQDLRQHRGRDHLPRLDVDHQPGAALRRDARRGARPIREADRPAG